ncbi:MAG: FG-GAP-like repeat-containing protein, partial [Bacteroidota bacterium]|nr:FG-GAP-like repeat-containing protein [Candidatus Kapabacteria bacterium]MDW8220703.1 FG-GAP-like repeat-containing protein [Bacteroidota bacterium]
MRRSISSLLFCALLMLPGLWGEIYAQAPAWSNPLTVGGGGINDDLVHHVVLDEANNAVYVCGSFVGTVDFDPSAGTANLTSNAGSRDMYIAKYNAATGAYLWAIAIGGTGNDDQALRMALDASGNLYVCGTFSGTADFNPLGVPLIATSVASPGGFIARYSPSGLCDWVVGIGTLAAMIIRPTGITVAGSDVYVTGGFVGTLVDFNPLGTSITLTSAGSEDIFVAKYATATGIATTVMRIGGTGLDYGTAVAVDGSGDLWVTGTFTGGMINFNPLGTAYNLTSLGGRDAFLAKYSAATLQLVGGTSAWRFGSSGAANHDAGKALAVDASGNVYVFGEFMGIVDFNTVVPPVNCISMGAADCFIASYTSSGALRWVNTIGTTVGGDEAHDIVVRGGSVYVCGSVGSAVADFDGHPTYTTPVSGMFNRDGFIAWYSESTGEYQRGKRFVSSGTGNEAITGIAVHSSSADIWCGGHYVGTMDVDPRPTAVQGISSSGSLGGFAMRYTPTVPETYTWNVVGIGAWDNSANWTPNRTDPCGDDILIFPSAASSQSVTGVPSQQVGKMVFQNTHGTFLDPPAPFGPPSLLKVTSLAAPALDIQTNTLVTIGTPTTGRHLRFAIGTGATCSIAGTLRIAHPNGCVISTAGSTVSITGTGTLRVAGPYGVNGTRWDSGAIIATTGSTIVYDPQASFEFVPSWWPLALVERATTGLQAIPGLKPAITQAKNVRSITNAANQRVMLDGSIALSGILEVTGTGVNGGLSVTSASILTLGIPGSVVGSTANISILEIIDGAVHSPNPGTLTFDGPGRLILCSDGDAGTSGLFTGNPPVYTTTSTLAYHIKNANRTTTDIELPTTMNGTALVNGFSGATRTLTLNNAKTLAALTVSNGTLTLAGGTTTVNGPLNMGSTMPIVTDGRIDLAGQTLSVLGNINIMGTSVFRGTASSNLLLGDGNDTFTGTLRFEAGGRQLNSFTVNLSFPSVLAMGSDLTVSGTLTLAQGRVNGTSPMNFLRVTNPLPSSVVRTNGYVSGPLERQLQANVSTDGVHYLFPIGDAMNYRPVELRNIRTGMGTPQVRATYYASGAMTFNPPVGALVSGQNWHIEEVSAGFNQSTIWLENGAALPSDARVLMSSTQAGAYSTIHGTPSGSLAQSAPLLALANNYFAIGTAPLPQPSLVGPSTVPATNSTTTLPNVATQITFSYHEPMNPPVASNFFVHGTLRGYRTGGIASQPSSTQLRITTPVTKPFASGEYVSVTVTNATSQAFGTNPRPHVHTFWAAANGGAGRFVDSRRFDHPGGTQTGVALADLNNDGNLDVIQAGAGVYWRANTGGGILNATPTSIASDMADLVVAADFDNDGWTDVAFTKSSMPVAIHIYRNTGGGTFTAMPWASISAGNMRDCAVADMDGDGDMDIVAYPNATGDVRVYRNHGGGMFTVASIISLPTFAKLCLADVDVDGDIDILLSSTAPASTVQIFLNTGVGTFDATPNFTYALGGVAVANILRVGRFNNDEYPDIVVGSLNSSDIFVMLNQANGTGAYNPPTAYNTGGALHTLPLVADFDGDNLHDIVVEKTSDDDPKMLFYKGNGAGAFTLQSSSPLMQHRTAMGQYLPSVVGDIDGDGDIDIVTPLPAPNARIALLYNHSPELKVTTTVPPPNASSVAEPITITANFNQSITSGTYQFPSNSPPQGPMRIYGSMSGGRSTTAMQGSWSGGTNTAIYTPNTLPISASVLRRFFPGEKVEFIVSTSTRISMPANTVTMTTGTVRNFWVKAGPGPMKFFEVQRLPAGTNPRSIVTADFNKDGFLDLCAANESSGNLTLTLGAAGGIFGTPTTIPLTGFTNLAGIAAGDFNNDGNPDLAVAANPNVCVLLGNGAGGFSAPVGYPSGPGVARSGLAVGDCTGDGALDILVANTGAVNGNITVLPNRGDGTFDTPIISQSVSNAFAVACGDIDNDGDLDAVVSQALGTNMISVMWNQDGTGYMSVAMTTTGPSDAYDIALGDINSDGWLDIIATQNGSPGGVAVYLNNGDGTVPIFPSSTYTVGNAAASSVVGDVNGDGALDIVTTSELSNNITVLRGNNSGTFVGETFPGGTLARSWSTVGDFDNDGDLDVAVANWGDNSITIFLNTTQPRFVCTAGCGAVSYTPSISPQRNSRTAAQNAVLSWQFTEPMTSATITAPVLHVWGGMTGRKTLGAWNYNPSTTTATFQPTVRFRPGEHVMVSVTNAQSVHRVNARPYVYGFHVQAGAGPGTFYESPFSPHSTGLTPVGVAAGDVDSDGDIDIAVAHQGANTLAILLNDGRGDFSTQAPGSPIPGIMNASSVQFADVNNDGLLDLVALVSTGSGSLVVRLNSGGGNFTTSAPGSPYNYGGILNTPTATTVADFDADGDLDITIANNAGGDVRVCFNNGVGGFTTISSAYPVAANLQKIAAADVDNDGDIDIVVISSLSGAHVLLNSGTGNFTLSATPFAGVADVRGLALGDVNGDGFIDMALANYGSNSVTVRLNDGTGSFVMQAPGSPYAVGVQPESIVLGDIDGDSDWDMVCSHNSTDGVAVRLNDGSGNFGSIGLNSPIRLAGVASMRSAVLADVDSDGDLDILVTRSSGIRVSVLLNRHPDVTACFGHALVLNGTSSYADVMPTSALGTGSFTFEALVKTAGSTAPFFSCGDATMAHQGFQLYTQGTSGRFEFRWSGSSGVSVNPGVNVQDGRWHHLAVVYKAVPSDSVFLYVDGILRGAAPNPSAGLNNLTSPQARIGMLIPGVSPIFQGSIDEVRLWNTALSQTTLNRYKGVQIDAPTHPNWSNLVLYNRFNEGVGRATYNSVDNSVGILHTTGTELPRWELSNAGCSMIADMYVPPASQVCLPAATQRPLGTGALSYALTAAPTLGGATLTPASTATYTAWLSITENGLDSLGYSVSDGITSSTATMRVQFTPKLQGLTVYAQSGVPTPLHGSHQILGGVTPPVEYMWTGLSGASFDLTNPAVPVITTLANITLGLTIRDAFGFTTSTTVSVIALGGDALTFSSTQRGLSDGFNNGSTLVVSRAATPFTVSVFRSLTLLHSTNASVQWTIEPLPGSTAEFTVVGSSQATFSNSPTFSTVATFVWRNAPPQGGSTQAIIRVSTTNGLVIFSTQITVTVFAYPAQALRWAASQISSTGTHGVNFGAFNQGQLTIVSGKPFNVAFGAFNGWNELAPTSASVRASLQGSGGETDGFRITSATLVLTNQASGIFTGLAIDWLSPLASSTTVVLRIESIAGALLQSTSVTLTLTTIPLEPIITTFSPTTGANGSIVTVQGLNLGNVTSVRVGGVPVRSMTINSPTQISIVVSTGATGLIAAYNIAGVGFSQVPFIFVSPPSGLTLSSTQAAVGQTVVVSGAHLVNVQAVFVGGVPSPFVSTNGQVIVTIPPNAQSGNITVQTLGGSALSPHLTIIPRPIIIGVSPASVAVGGMISITGAHFSAVTAVSVGGVSVASFMVLSSTQIVAVLSTNAVSGFVQVRALGGVTTSTVALIVHQPPRITAISHTMPIVGSEVTLTGANFVSGMTVTLGGVPVHVQVLSPMQAVVTMPDVPTSGTITVTTPFGTASSGTLITVLPRPVVPSNIDFTPSFGTRGSQIVITGQGFVSVREVSIGGVPVERFIVETSERIVAVVSTGATGAVRVSSTTGTGVSERIFTFLTPLQLDSTILVQFFRDHNGLNWHNRNNWLSPLPVQFWYGVNVEQGRVASLRLPYNNLIGSLTRAIVQLSSLTGLRVLNLSGNTLPGALPTALGRMRSLRE